MEEDARQQHGPQRPQQALVGQQRVGDLPQPGGVVVVGARSLKGLEVADHVHDDEQGHDGARDGHGGLQSREGHPARGPTGPPRRRRIAGDPAGSVVGTGTVSANEGGQGGLRSSQGALKYSVDHT